MRTVLPITLLATALAGGLLANPSSGALLAQDVARPLTDLTPREAVQLGLEHNQRIRAAQADADGALAAFHQARASRLPSVRIRGDYRRLVGDLPDPQLGIPDFDPGFALFRIPRDQIHTELSLEQPLFQGGALRNRALAAEHEADAAMFLADQERTDMALAVRTAYWGLYRALAVEAAAEAALEQMEAHVDHLENLLEEGVILRSDLLAARTRRSEVRLDGVEAANAVRVARLELNRLIGLPLDEEFRLVSDEIDPAFQAGVELGELVERALAGSPQLRAMAERARALDRRVGETRGAWLPQISLVARYTYARPNPLVFTEMDEFRALGEAGVLLSWSVFEGGRRPAQTAQARAQVRAAEARLTDAREEVAVRVRRQHLEALHAQEALAVAVEHAEEAEETFRVVQEQFEEGVILSAQVLEAEQVHRSAQARHAAAEAALAIAQAALLHALGDVW